MKVKVNKVENTKKYKEFVVKNSDTYKFMIDLNKKYQFNEHSTVIDYQEYLDQINKNLPHFMTYNEIERIDSTLSDIDIERIKTTEEMMVQILANVNAEIKDSLRQELIHNKMDTLDEEDTNGFISLEEMYYQKRNTKEDPAGVYIIKNVSEDIYYVGQATRLFFRLNQHFSGKGNKDIFKDYKNGDVFMVKIMKLANSGYESLGLFERETIKKYASFDFGYNKTKGNIE